MRDNQTLAEDKDKRTTALGYRANRLVELLRETAPTERHLVPFPGEEEWARLVVFEAMPVCDPEWERYLAGGDEPSWWRKKRRPPLMQPASPSAALSLEETLNRLGRVRPKGDEWHALCPAHEDRHRSLIISESDYKPGEPVFFCYAGCTHQAVKDALLRVEQ